MKPVIEILEQRVSQAMHRVIVKMQAADTHDNTNSADRIACAAIVKPAQSPRFGDYQANGVMGLAKKLRCNPRELAVQVVAELELDDICEQPEIAGPGFINLRIKDDWLCNQLREAVKDDRRFGIDVAENAPVTVVDFSSPNLAKEMHVGHLRSTIIGDVFARVLEFWYDKPQAVIRQNHVGDWGTQFGMLIAYLDKVAPHSSPQELSIGDMEQFYRQAKQCFDSDANFAATARNCVVRLQSGDADIYARWKTIVSYSLQHAEHIYQRLGVKLTQDDVRGESFYNDKLKSVVDDLDALGMLKNSYGAGCVFLDGFNAKDGQPLPLIVQKSDGGYLYATTDLAAIRYRINQLKAKRIIYVTDARQKLHFEMVFACARQAGWVPDDVSLEHVPFGSVTGPDGKPFKTRSGENVKLAQLLDEAQTRARKVVEQKNASLPEQEKQKIAQTVGIGAVKYADLSNNLVSDYVFDWDKMLAMDGNTAPYMQYAFARIQSIFRKGKLNNADIKQLQSQADKLILNKAEEKALAKQLLKYSEIIATLARELRPHLLTGYLFELTQAFSSFYNACPVLQADTGERTSRLILCCQTSRIIQHGLGLLGIGTIDQM